MSEELKFYTVKEVAAIFNIGKQTVYAMVKRGELASVRVSDSIRVPKWAVDDILESSHR